MPYDLPGHAYLLELLLLGRHAARLLRPASTGSCRPMRRGAHTTRPAVDSVALEAIRERREGPTVTISLAEDVKTVEDLEKDPRALLGQAQRTGRPIVIAEAGKPATVLISAERYEWLVHLVNFARLVNEGEQSIREGRVRPIDEFERELEDEGKLPRRNRRPRRGRSASNP